MCGLAGVYSTNFGAWEYDVFQKLLLLNVFRGDDSTGVIRAETSGRILTRKSLLPSPAFLVSDVSDIIEDSKNFKKPYCLMGHTRAATKGAVTLKNAHPFGFNRVVGMHNGTIHTSFKTKPDFETDSEAFYKLLNDEGLKPALEEIEAYDTAYAFQWIDKKEKTLNFIKNDKRPLHFTYAFAGTTLIWSSDANDIRYVLRAKKYDNHEGWDRNKTDKIFSLHENHLFSIPLGKDPERDCQMEKIEVKKKYATYTTITRVGGSSGSTSTTRTQTSANPNLGTYGEWVETQAGWRYVQKEGNLPSPDSSNSVSSEENRPSKSSSNSPNETSTTTAGTSGKTKGTPGTSTDSSDSGKEVSRQPRDRSFRDEYGPDRLKTLDWLGSPVDYVKDDKDESVEASRRDLDDSSCLDHLFDTDHKAANNPDGLKPSNVVPFKKGKDRKTSGGGSLRGFQGELISESEFRFHLSNGCFCCGEKLSLDNPHDFAQINNIHWWSRELWACDYCFATSENDWVRKVIEDDWGSEDKSSNIKK